MRHALLALLVLTLVGTSAPAQPEEDAPPARVVLPDTKAGRELGWVLRVLNGEPPGDIATRFTPEYLERYSIKEVTDVLTTLRQKAFGGNKVRMVRVDEFESPDQLEGVINGDGTDKFISVFLTLHDKTGLIAGLQFNPTGYSCQAGDWDSYGGELGKLAGAVAFGCYEVVPKDKATPAGEQRLVSVYEFKERDSLAVAAAFKLWVLGAAGERVASGAVAWDDAVTLRDDLRSMPGGPFDASPSGSGVPARTLARSMIGESDDTATDHLIAWVGRAEVEAYVKRLFKDSRRTVPLMLTRQFFYLRLNADDDLRDRYAQGNAEQREALLADGGPIGLKLPEWSRTGAWTTPRDVDRIEYFACVEDMCRVLADLRRLELRPGMGPISAALGADGGPITLSPDRWTSVGYRGGSEPGVLSHFWLLERADGRHYAMGMIWNNTKKNLSTDRFAELARAGLVILEKHGGAGGDE